MNNKVVDITGKAVVPGQHDTYEHEFVCEHCAYGRFKDAGPHGECRFNPPTTGMLLIPVQSLQGQALQPQQYSVFPIIERRMYCCQFEDKEVESST